MRHRFNVLLFILLCSFAPTVRASDHADPIDPFNKERLEAGITDLFAFPVTADGLVAFPFLRTDSVSLAKPLVDPRQPLSAEQQAQIKGMVVILNVRRALTQASSLMLEPFTYRIHMDLKSTVSFDNSPTAKPAAATGGGGYASPSGPMKRQRKPLTGEEARARYGGLVDHPEGIEPTVTIEISLQNNASLKRLKITGLSDPENISHSDFDPKRISLWTGIRDDPFIFPAFFNTNVVSMIFYLPLTAFPAKPDHWLLWATSHEGSRQIDHVGRSLRTQNPRFEILNTVKPRQQTATIHEADDNPTLKRDVALRLTLNQLVAYRDWDFVPDVMIYSSRYPVGFPNGRVLFDDVAALLAQHGDTLLFELSHEHPNGGWPRRTTNDKPFLHTTEDKPELAKWPFLAEPVRERDPPKGPMLNAASEMKIAAIAIGILVALAVFSLLFAKWYHHRKQRQRYL